MFIEVAELELHPIDFQEEFPPDVIDLGAEVRQRTPLKTSGRAQLVEELSVTGAEAEIGYYEGDSLLLEDVLREQTLLAVPLKVLCREDCKGLCPTCGKNRNVELCACAATTGDPRWEALKDIREKLQN